MYKRIINKFFRGVIDQAESEDEKEVVIYGLEVILSQAVGTLALLLVGIFSHSLLGTVIFILCFSTIRVVAGGYHANTHLFCFLDTVLSYLFIIIVDTYVTREYNVVFMSIAGIFYFIILVLAPIINDKRKFSNEEIHSGKKKVRGYLILELLITIVLYQVNYELYKFAVYAIILEGVCLILGKIKYRDLNKKTLLKSIKDLSTVVAEKSAGKISINIWNEPEIPKSLKKKLEK